MSLGPSSPSKRARAFTFRSGHDPPDRNADRFLAVPVTPPGQPKGSMIVLDSTKIAALPQPPPRPIPPIAGSFLAQNRLSSAARIQIALRLLHGEAVLEKPTVTQVARLAGVNRQRIYESGGVDLRRKVKGVAIARAFQRASPEERIAFVRAIGSEEIWHVLTLTL